MYRTGHYGAALLTYAPVGIALMLVGFEAAAVVGGMGVLALARLPDYDLRVPFVSHRGPTHTLGFALLVGLVVGAGLGTLAVAGAESGTVDETGVLPSVQVVAVAAFGFLVGFLAVVSHLLADALTPAGIEPWWPLTSKNYSLQLVGADSTVGNYGLLALGVFVSAVSLLVAGPLR
jgi:inner membrane protein